MSGVRIARKPKKGRDGGRKKARAEGAVVPSEADASEPVGRAEPAAETEALLVGGVLNRSKRKKGVTRVCAALDVPYVQTVAVGPSQEMRRNTLLDSGAAD